MTKRKEMTPEQRRRLTIDRKLRAADLRAGGYTADPERLADVGGSNMLRADLPPVKGPRDV